MCICFGIFFVESSSEKSWVGKDSPCFGIFWAYGNNVIDVIDCKIFFACVTYWGKFFGDEEGVGEMRVAYSDSGYIISSLIFRLRGIGPFLGGRLNVS